MAGPQDRTGESRFQERFGPVRAAICVDGFNLYHRSQESRLNDLKWQNQWRLSRLICSRHGTSLVTAGFFTAVPDDPPDIRLLHLICTAAPGNRI
jgi:hypothetical protein